MIARKEVSCEELARLYLDRIDRHDSRINAFVEVYRREAIVTARLKDRRTREGAKPPPFHGVPIGIKDLNLVRGRRTRFGSKGILPFWSPVDDATVAQLRRAGFVILGKLSTPELGALPVTEPEIHPPTRNPWNPEHSAGGSSGGSGAAVAARLLPLAQGTDGGGSIRIPSSFNGLVGLKPSRGRIRNMYGLPDKQILYTSGVLTRTVDDSAALLDILAGLTEGKPHWATPPEELYSALSRKTPRPLRIRMTIDSPLVSADPEVREAVLRVARALESLGHRIEESPGPSGEIDEFLPLWGLAMSKLPLMRWSRAEPITQWLRDIGIRHDPADVSSKHQALEDRILEWFKGADLWLTPTTSVLAPKVGAISQAGDPREAFFKYAAYGAFTAFSNITGQPAISVPAGMSKSGLPMGAQLVGPPQDEAIVLQVARQLEEALPWTHGAPAAFRQ